MTERRIMTLLGKKLQKKGKSLEVISSIMAKLEMIKNIHLFSIWYHLNILTPAMFISHVWWKLKHKGVQMAKDTQYQMSKKK